MTDEQEQPQEQTTSHFEGIEIVVRFHEGQPWTPEIVIPEGASPPMMYAAAETIRFLADLNMAQQMSRPPMPTKPEIVKESKMPVSLGDFLPGKRKGN